ncbi:hypothetical protein SAMN05421693_10921 [Ectothiorhodospira magna]|uniref:Uncharacterized protein n=1 Tax=Ectothiorhodospira magna TaxID=867345 RepID=A0A1H9BI66_9GAMM|nr:hypothetical protein [Ectothiorhodospira magna]SEP88313.1 hypothetical protein SAMN05421693_10921 [Ectothiorhodospira magna]
MFTAAVVNVGFHHWSLKCFPVKVLILWGRDPGSPRREALTVLSR